ncbi:MAG TPA: N-acetylneuraminate synthase [Bacteroidia bacterium]|nr:N-acetylneuraminate synthase [Bacteroidia bacterium]
MKHVFIIAEAGVNHNGSLELAKKLVDAAKDAGADVVKFQTFIPELVMSRHAPKAAYQKEVTGQTESQLDMVRKLQLDKAAHDELMKYCKTKQIQFLSTPFDLPSIDLLQDMGLDILKIPSGEITNFPYLHKIGSLKKKVILSTGMAKLGEVEQAIDTLCAAGTQREMISVLHCNTEYPTPMKDVNLLAMITMRDAFKLEVGYSDHTLGIEVPVAAVALGATIIEKHLTLDKNMPGPDHKASLDPAEFKAMVTAIRNIESALGDGIKRPSPSESKNMSIARKSIHISKNLPAGHVLSIDDLSVKRPGDGISSLFIDIIVGKKLRNSVEEDHKIAWNDLI